MLEILFVPGLMFTGISLLSLSLFLSLFLVVLRSWSTRSRQILALLMDHGQSVTGWFAKVAGESVGTLVDTLYHVLMLVYFEISPAP